LDQDHDSWAVERLKDGEAETTLVKPWTMGSDKKNPWRLRSSAPGNVGKLYTASL